MIEKYVTFNAKRFLVDYYKNQHLIHVLEHKLEDIISISSPPTDTDRVQSSPSGSKVELQAIQRMAIQERIAECKEQVDACEKALRTLTEEERDIIEVFFHNDKEIPAVEILEASGISKSTAYAIRKSALDKISTFVAGVHAR